MFDFFGNMKERLLEHETRLDECPTLQSSVNGSSITEGGGDMVSLQVFAMAIKARTIMSSLGARAAAGYLRNRGISLQRALQMLGLPEREV